LEENSSFPILSEANVFLKSAATGLAASVNGSEGRIDDLFPLSECSEHLPQAVIPLNSTVRRYGSDCRLKGSDVLLIFAASRCCSVLLIGILGVHSFLHCSDWVSIAVGNRLCLGRWMCDAKRAKFTSGEAAVGSGSIGRALRFSFTQESSIDQ
jgi:hypothetical protein